MTDITEITRFATRMKAAINQAVYAMECKSGSANDKATLLAMMHDILNNGSRMIEECTKSDKEPDGRSFMLMRSKDSILDDLSDSFDDLIAQEAEEAEQRREEFVSARFPRSVVSTVARDVARL